MIVTDKLRILVKEQIAVEDLNVKEVGETEKKLGNEGAKLILHMIKMDSQKHADVLNGIVGAMNDIPPSETLWEHSLESYVDPIAVKKDLERHVKREASMIKQVEKEIKETQDEGLRVLLSYIVEEERKHHEMLQTVLKHIP